MLVIIFLAKNLGNYVRLVMLCYVKVRLKGGKKETAHHSRSAAVLCLQFFLFTSDYSRLWFIYLLLSLFNE